MAAADLAGTGVFALQGALVAGAAGLDWLGITVIAFVTALGGGMVRDVLLGATPPAALRNKAYPLVVLAAAAIVLAGSGLDWHRLRPTLLTLDAAGLSLFMVAGTEKAIEAGCPAFAAVMLGTMTATGGGALRDVLLAQVPVILRADFYASAALAGAGLLLLARRIGLGPRGAAALGGLACFALRLAGASLGWHLPRL